MEMLFALLAVAAAPAPPQDSALVTPRVVSEAELRGRGFDTAWEFPRHRPNGTAYPGVAFEEANFRLVRAPLVPASAGTPAIWLGDSKQR